MSNFTDFFEEYDRLRFEYRSTEDFLTFLGVENPATLACRLNAYKRNKLVPPPRLIHAPKIKKAGVLQKPTFSHETKLYLIRSNLIISFFKRSYGV